jgi:hypothetical protein
MTHAKLSALAAAGLLAAGWPEVADAAPATVLYNDEIVLVQQTLADPDDLWVVPEDLTRINGFVLKGDALCLGDFCVPARQNADGSLLIVRSGQEWVSVTELARRIHTPAVRDWVLKGAASEYVWTPEKVASKIRRRTADEALAEPTFKLGVYFFQRQDEARARTNWKRAEELHPDSWNYHRQDWTFTAETSFGRSFQQKRSALGDTPYYEPLDLPPAGGQPSPSGQQAPRPDRR